MFSMYFGLPGSGKTTQLVKLAYNASFKKRSPYKHIYGNLNLVGIPNYIKIDVNDIGKYMLEDCLILIDEATVHFDNRDFKNFAKQFTEFFCLHRHYSADIAVACQQYNGTDKRLRSLVDRLYWVKKGTFTGFYKSKIWRIPYDVIIPDKKDTGSAHLGEIVEGYCKPPFLTRLFSPSLKRKKYYPYFDSWERKELPALPADRSKEQAIANRVAISNLEKRLETVKPWQIFKLRKYRFMIKKFKRVLTNL